MRSENYPQLILRSETVLAVKGACRSFFLSVEKQAQNKNSVYRWPGESLAVALVLGRDLADGGGASSRWLWFVGAWSLRDTELQIPPCLGCCSSSSSGIGSRLSPKFSVEFVSLEVLGQ